VTPEEDRQLRALGDALAVVTGWEQVVEEPSGPWRVEAGSDLAGDDDASHPYQVSGAARAAIAAAVSHAGCLRDSIFLWTGPDRVTARLHPYGQLALVRGALENASRAVWLLAPDDRATRVLRRLQQEYAEARELRGTLEIIGSPPEWTMPARLQELAVLARAAGADPGLIRSGFGYREITRVAGAQVPSAPQVAEVIWKACSAIAHGDMRGTAAYLPGETVGQAAPGVALNRVTANVLLTVTGAMNALATTRIALDLHARRARGCSWPPRVGPDSQGTSGSADTG
jgi:hypothetical protein